MYHKYLVDDIKNTKLNEDRKNVELGSKISLRFREQICDAYKKGYLLEDIVTKSKLPVSTIYEILKTKNIKLRNKKS